MEIINKRLSNINKNIYKREKIKAYRTNKDNRYKRKYRKNMDIREIIMSQCIVCSVFLLVILAFNYIDNEFVYNFRKDLKKLISEDIKKDNIVSYLNLVSNKFKIIRNDINDKFYNANNSNKIKKDVFYNEDKGSRIDEDILEQIEEYEKERLKFIEERKSIDCFKKNNTIYGIKKDNKIWLNPSNGVVTSLFGTRINPVSKKEEFHNGIDISMEENTELICIRDGIVTDISFSKTFGNVLKYKVDDSYEIMYAHLNDINVDIGDNIKQGDVIALSGNTGLTTGPHLHYTIWKDKELIDPIDYVKLKCTKDIEKELEKREAS